MVSSSAKETGADIGCTLIGIVFNSPLNYNCLPKQSKLKGQSGNETVEGDVSFHARQILIKIEGGKGKGIGLHFSESSHDLCVDFRCASALVVLFVWVPLDYLVMPLFI